MTAPSHSATNTTGELKVRVDLAERGYDIAITSGQMDRIATRLDAWMQRVPGAAQTRRQCLIVTDKNLAVLHATTVAESLASDGWKVETAILPAGEQSKSLETAAGLYDRLVQMQADRQTVVIAVGGGVVGDAAGFVAATYNRGIPFVQVPTSLLAQVDSSVGGKVAVNHPQGKNLIGAFYQPLGVFIDTTVLATLPARDYASGLGEVVKYGVILDSNFFETLESRIDELNARDATTLREAIARSCELKARVVEEDEQELTGLRAVLNYGHTFAHALEALCGYGVLMHGEAVAIGMVQASRLAELRGLIPADLTERQRSLLTGLHLPTHLPEGISLDPHEVIERMRLDKKAAAGQLRFVLPTRLGHVEVFRDVPESDVEQTLRETL